MSALVPHLPYSMHPSLLASIQCTRVAKMQYITSLPTSLDMLTPKLVNGWTVWLMAVRRQLCSVLTLQL
jgi:hypothetical protein